MADTPVIRLVDVRKVYKLKSGDVPALRGITFDIMKGEFVAIMGPSGSGKSTLMNMIGCLDVPTSGNLYLEGRNVREMSDDELTFLRRDEIGFIFQKFNLIPLLTAFENTEYPIILKTGHMDEEGKTMRLLKMVGLSEELVTHRPSELSGGQQQRVAIARALVNDPALLLCDEPTGNLDSVTGSQIMEILEDLNKEGRTIVMVTHDPHIAEYAHRTIRIIDGNVATA
ncbi:MAG TPA: ABC transporter ATP-binding protein [Methanoregulaceae archaeon]|nr:ABC transporter ATP-binding protein [Methanoregulaceae archaeon]